MLLRSLLLPLLALLGLTAVVGYPLALYPATAIYDWALLDSALSLSRAVHAEGLSGARLSTTADILMRTDKFDRIYYSVHDARGRLIAGDRDLPVPEIRDFVEGELLYDSRLNKENIRVAALLVQGRDGFHSVVQVAETLEKRRRLTAKILISTIASELIVILSVIILVWHGIGEGLEPLRRLGQEIKKRSSRDLRPVRADLSPLEVRPVVSALNALLEQLNAALRARQQFVADAAHQLRTPLAGLCMQVELGLQQEDPAQWRRALEALQPATERVVHLANQLLVLARAEVGPAQIGLTQQVDLRGIVETVTAEWMPRAIARDIDLGLELEPAVVEGNSVLLGELVSNLIDNAIHYIPQRGRITLRTRTAADRVELEVEDNGSGIPEAERQKVFTRFYRIDGSAGDGCGLGLAIVQEIAQLHRGDVVIRSPREAQGTVVAVAFPAAVPQPVTPARS